MGARAEMVEAGVALGAAESFQALLDGIPVRRIAAAAGVSPGSFHHHFRSRTAFVEAVVDHWAAAWAARSVDLGAQLDAPTREPGVGPMRAAAQREWESLCRADPVDALRHVLWALRAQPVAGAGTRPAGELLQDAYRQREDIVAPLYARGLRGLGREVLPPFTIAEYALIAGALADGLQMRAAVEPGAVRADLYADAVGALVLGFTRPRGPDGDGDRADLRRLEQRLVVNRTARSEPDGSRPEMWRHIVTAAAHLFADRSPDEVGMAEVAAAAGVAEGVVRQHLGTVSAVAAYGWVRHLDRFREVGEGDLGPDEDPLRRIELILVDFVSLARAERGAAEGLVSHLLREMSPRRPNDLPPLRHVVPMPAILAEQIGELRRRGRLRRRIEIERLARSLTHLVTMQALLFPDESEDRIVDETMTLVFDGALRSPSDEPA